MAKGTLHGVGVGPGDPQLLTLKAVAVIARCPVVAAPKTAGGATVALDIVQAAMDLRGKQVLELDFAMRRNPAERAAAHERAADALRAVLDGGRDVAMLNLGDVSVYASFQYMNERLSPEGYPVVMVPGVTSFCAAAAALGESLTDMDAPLVIVPGGVEEAKCGTRVYMKSGKALGALLEKLAAEGRLAHAAVVQNCGMENERVLRGDALMHGDVQPDYFSLVIVKGEAVG